MPSDATRMLRGTSVVALSTLVTAAAHTAGGGAVPSETTGLLLIVICSAVGCAAASIRGLSRIRLMAALGTAQALGHLTLTAGDMHHHGATMDRRMLGAHLLAIVTGALLIRAAERGMRWAISTLRRVAPRPAPRLTVRAPFVPVSPAYRVALTPRLADLSGAGTRGPPCPA
jgi:hypothetical protein